MALADSLDRIGSLYNDTSALRKAAGDLCALNHRTEKAKALYYLGRNYSLANLDATAVDCYIAADRLKPKDSQLRGRLNGNMAYICKQQNKDSLALIMYGRTIPFYEKTNDSLRLISIALDVSLAYCNVRDFKAADSVWNRVVSKNLNSKCYSRAMGVRAYYYNVVHKYDSALYYLNKVDLSQVSSLDFYNAQRAIALFYTGQPDSAASYASNIIKSISSSRNKIIAYTVLREKAYKDNDICTAQKMHDNVENMQNYIDVENEERIRAAVKIEYYLAHPEFKIRKWILFSIISIACIISALVLWLFLNQKRSIELKEKSKILKEREININSISQEQIDNVKNNINKLSFSRDWKTILNWKDIDDSIFKINIYLNNMAQRLKDEYKLNVVDIRYCTMLLLKFDSKYISENLPYSYSGMKTLKKRISLKIGIFPQELSVFLTDFVLKKGGK